MFSTKPSLTPEQFRWLKELRSYALMVGFDIPELVRGQLEALNYIQGGGGKSTMTPPVAAAVGSIAGRWRHAERTRKARRFPLSGLRTRAWAAGEQLCPGVVLYVQIRMPCSAFVALMHNSVVELKTWSAYARISFVDACRAVDPGWVRLGY
jgi:hypothetical protein